jgi:hypothetical protein
MESQRRSLGSLGMDVRAGSCVECALMSFTGRVKSGSQQMVASVVLQKEQEGESRRAKLAGALERDNGPPSTG